MPRGAKKEGPAFTARPPPWTDRTSTIRNFRLAGCAQSCLRRSQDVTLMNVVCLPMIQTVPQSGQTKIPPSQVRRGQEHSTTSSKRSPTRRVGTKPQPRLPCGTDIQIPPVCLAIAQGLATLALAGYLFCGYAGFASRETDLPNGRGGAMAGRALAPTGAPVSPLPGQVARSMRVPPFEASLRSAYG